MIKHCDNRWFIMIPPLCEAICLLLYLEGVKCRLQVRVAGHCFTISETTQTFAKMLTLGLNIIFWAMC